MIELKNISKSYNKGAVKAVDSLSLKVNPGEIFGFIGPNRAGLSFLVPLPLLPRDILAAMVVGAALLFAVFACSYFAGGAGFADYAVYLIFLTVSLLSGAVPYLIMLKIAAKRFRSIDI